MKSGIYIGICTNYYSITKISNSIKIGTNIDSITRTENLKNIFTNIYSITKIGNCIRFSLIFILIL